MKCDLLVAMQSPNRDRVIRVLVCLFAEELRDSCISALQIFAPIGWVS